jgi:DNA-binding transcriptional MerR regulator
MNLPNEIAADAVQLFEPALDAVYTIEAAGRLVRVPRRMIALYSKHGLVSPVVDPACGGYYFNDEAIRTLRRIEYLRTVCGLNLVGIKMILHLMNEVERLRTEARFLRGL